MPTLAVALVAGVALGVAEFAGTGPIACALFLEVAVGVATVLATTLATALPLDAMTS